MKSYSAHFAKNCMAYPNNQGKALPSAVETNKKTEGRRSRTAHFFMLFWLVDECLPPALEEVEEELVLTSKPKNRRRPGRKGCFAAQGKHGSLYKRR